MGLWLKPLCVSADATCCYFSLGAAAALKLWVILYMRQDVNPWKTLIIVRHTVILLCRELVNNLQLQYCLPFMLMIKALLLMLVHTTCTSNNILVMLPWFKLSVFVCSFCFAAQTTSMIGVTDADENLRTPVLRDKNMIRSDSRDKTQRLQKAFYFEQIIHDTAVFVEVLVSGISQLLFTQTKFSWSSPSAAVSFLPPITPTITSPCSSHNLPLTALTVLKYSTEHSHHLPSKAEEEKKLHSLDTFFMSQIVF